MHLTKKDKNGFVHVVEFMLAFTVFILILAGFFNAINLFSFPIEIEPRGFGIAVSLTETIIGNSGLLKNNSTNWEDYNETILKNNITKFGLAKDNIFGVLSLKKIDALKNLSYATIKEVMNLKENENFNITIVILNQTTQSTILSWGAIYGEDISKATVVRIVKVYDENSGIYIDAKLILYY